jgi:hypothetical protein
MDRLKGVEDSIRAGGYGGDLKPVLLTYLCATTRVLKMRRGTMPAHVLLHGDSSAGKSYTKDTILRLLPRAAYHVINAGSPKVLIYDEADLQHRLLVFGEADSLPAGEDNPAASAIRNLLQDGFLHYDVVSYDNKKQKFRVHHVRKKGPTVLLTTSTRRLGRQLDTRVFTVDVPDDAGQIRAALKAQAVLETEGARRADPSLVRHQAYLQERAPWDVQVPFAERLSDELGKGSPVPRALRDFSKLLSLTKAVALLRLSDRRTDSQGGVIAEIEDYAAVYELVKEAYSASVTGGATPKLRSVVGAVADLQPTGHVTVTRVAHRLGIDKGNASRHVAVAIERGWLINEEYRKGNGYPMKLIVGEALPKESGLPHPRVIRGVAVLRPLPEDMESGRR